MSKKYESALPKKLREALDKSFANWHPTKDHSSPEYHTFHWAWKFGFMEACQTENVLNYSSLYHEIKKELEDEKAGKHE